MYCTLHTLAQSTCMCMYVCLFVSMYVLFVYIYISVCVCIYVFICFRLYTADYRCPSILIHHMLSRHLCHPMLSPYCFAAEQLVVSPGLRNSYRQVFGTAVGKPTHPGCEENDQV